MNIPCQMPRLKGFRFAREIIAYAVWAYHRFALSTADVEDLLAERGVVVSGKQSGFGSIASGGILQSVSGEIDLRLAINVCSTFWFSHVGMRRPQGVSCAVWLLGSACQGLSLRTNSAATSSRSEPLAAEHRAHKGLNSAVEVSHRPTRKREKIFGRFKSPRQAQRFLAAHRRVNLIFRPHRHKITPRLAVTPGRMRLPSGMTIPRK